MADQTLFTLTLPPALRDAFVAAAAATSTPAEELIRDFMTRFVEDRRTAQEYDSWFHAEVEQALREADDPNVERIPHEQVMADLYERTARLRKQGDGETF